MMALTVAAMLLAPWQQNRDGDQSISASDSCRTDGTASTIANWRSDGSQSRAKFIHHM